MRKPKPPRPKRKAPEAKRPDGETRDGWSTWHRPKVFIPLLTVIVTAAGVLLALGSRGGEQHRGDIFNAPLEQVQDAPPAPMANVAGQALAPPAPAARTKSPVRDSGAPSARVARPRPSAPEAVPSPGLNIHVEDSPGAITAGTINANSIEVRPPQ